MELRTTHPDLWEKAKAISDKAMLDRSDHKRNVDYLLEAISLIPEPITQWTDGTTDSLANWLGSEYFELGDYDNAIHWGTIAVKTRENFHPPGFHLVLLGMAFYEKGDLDNAFICFDKGYNSGMKNRAFSGLDVKYFDFYRDRAGIPVKRKGK